MVNLETLIFEGKCFIPLKVELDNITKLKDIISRFMNKYQYIEIDTPIFFKDNFLSMEFSLLSNKKEPKSGIKIKKILKLINKEEYNWEKYKISLLSLRRDLPYKVSFLISREKNSNVEGFFLTIRTEPTLLFCIRQFDFSSIIKDSEYENIAITNMHFINQIMVGLWAIIVEEPKSIKKFIKTPLIEKLEKLNYNETSRLLKRGLENIERGGNGIVDGLTDLRSAIEKFVYETVEKIGEKPYSQQKLEENLKILEEKKHINKEVSKFICKSLNNWLWQYLSETVHKKEENINLTDAKFFYYLTEVFIEYLIDKNIFGI